MSALNIGKGCDNARPCEPNLLSSQGKLVRSQLSLELKLKQSCQELLHLYKESQNWAAVGQLAHTLVTNSQRVAQLKDQLRPEEVARQFLQVIKEDSRSRSLSPESLGSESASEISYTEAFPKSEIFKEELSSLGVPDSSIDQRTREEVIEPSPLSLDQGVENNSTDQVSAHPVTCLWNDSGSVEAGSSPTECDCVEPEGTLKLKSGDQETDLGTL